MEDPKAAPVNSEIKDYKSKTIAQKIIKILRNKRSPWILAGCGGLVIFFFIFAITVNSFQNQIKYKDNTIRNLESQINSLKSTIRDLEKDLEEKEEERKDIPTSGMENNGANEEIIQIEVDFFNEPEMVTGFSLFKTREVNGTFYDPDEDAKFYKAGKVAEGSYKGMDFQGYDYYVVDYSPQVSTEGLDLVRFIKKEGENQIHFIQYYLYPGNSEVIEDNIFKWDFEIVDLYKNVSFFIDEEESMWQVEVVSDNGNMYRYSGYEGIPFSDLDLLEVDSIDGVKVYIAKENKDGSSYVKSADGFIHELSYVPEIVEEIIDSYDEPISITWSDGSSNRSFYDYISIGGCFGNLIEVEEIDSNVLSKTGTGSEGSTIYEYTDQNDSYRREVYQEYIDGELYKYNDISEDDGGPFSYDKFVTKHPVFYWKDPFGRFIKFASRDFIFTGGCAKPIIYLYPQFPTEITVTIKPKGELTFSYPRYKAGWNVLVSPSGKIMNLGDCKTYDYLWWESRADSVDIPQEGFVVARDEIEPLLEEKLSRFGLNDKEINDFKEYWLLKMLEDDTPYYFISFLFNDEVNQIAELEFSKEPDSEMRIFMVYKPLMYREVVPVLEIPHHEREGFTVVEWGGARID
ncbi:hypothetical protein JW766_05135 [Candidatus Dojkabacteria bacterium]|nr:hypothetical protein [Candidatus Dojkabacteria bacterium]